MDNLSANTFTPFREKSGSSFRSKLLNPKIIFVILGIAVLIELIYAARLLTSPTPTPTPAISNKAVIPNTTPKLSLTTSKTNLAVNETVPVAVMVDSGGRIINGVDLVMHYDPKILDVNEGGLLKGRLFDEYPLLSVDAKKGVIAISGISQTMTGFKGVSQFATINLKAKAAGTTVLTIEFEGKEDTTDSNLVDAKLTKDILEQVGNLQITIK